MDDRKMLFILCSYSEQWFVMVSTVGANSVWHHCMIISLSSPSILVGEPQVSTVPCKYDLVGRHELCEMLVNIVLDGTQQRLVILTAPPGFGKSAVAMKVTHMLLDNDVRVLYHCLRKASSLAAVASSILKNLGISVVGIREPVCQAVQYLKQCEQSTVLVLDNAEDLLDDRNERDFKKFLEVITCHAPKVHTLVTTRIAIEGLQLALDILRVKKTVLPPLDPEESKEFLMLYLGLSNHKESEAKLLGKLCGGVPLLMQLTASVIHEGTSISSLAKELQFSPKRVLQNARNPDFELYYQDLELFMKQLPPGIQDALHCLSVFPASFSRSEARMLFTGDCWQYESTMSQLCSYGLIQKVTDCEKMSVHPLVQAFCKASHGQSRSKYSEAIKKFIVKYLEILRDANTRFVSTDCKHALEQYELNEDNIKHALKSAAEDEHMKVPGITVSTEVVSFLAKVMHMEEFLQIYEGFQGVAQDMDLKKHQAACLTSIGFKQLCYNGRCSTKEARETLTKALQFWKNEGLPSQEELAHCLSKLGLCLVRDGEEEEGVQKMAEAIIIRKQLVRARGGITERMLLGGSYCDLGSKHLLSLPLWIMPRHQQVMLLVSSMAVLACTVAWECQPQDVGLAARALEQLQGRPACL